MTDRLYQRDSYLETFEARVAAVRPEGVVLDRTAFFPSGGGVLGDEGALTGPGGETYRVVETLDDEDVVHRLDRGGLAVGHPVTGRLDWSRRYLLMRYHTATHVLTGVMFKDYQVRVTGNQLTQDKARVDFAFEQFDREVLEEGFRRANALIAQDLPVRISFVPAAEARARPELFKLETDVSPRPARATSGRHRGLRRPGRWWLSRSQSPRDRPAPAHQVREQGQGQSSRVLRAGRTPVIGTR